MKQFQNKVALITGGSSGLGKAIAIGFGKRGAKVVVCARNENAGQNVINLIKDQGAEGLFIKCDVSDSSQVKEMIRKTIDHFGSLDFGINNAAYAGSLTSIQDYSDDEFDKVIAINLRGTFLCMKYEILEMRKQKSGVIVNISSTAGLVGVAHGLSPYTASKHGIVGLTKSAALEQAEKGIRINAVCPGAMETEMLEERYKATGDAAKAREDNAKSYPIKRIAMPEEVANVAIWLCSSEASFITGIAFPIDGGKTAS